MRLMTIHNKLKLTISISGRLELLQLEKKVGIGSCNKTSSPRVDIVIFGLSPFRFSLNVLVEISFYTVIKNVSFSSQLMWTNMGSHSNQQQWSNILSSKTNYDQGQEQSEKSIKFESILFHTLMPDWNWASQVLGCCKKEWKQATSIRKSKVGLNFVHGLCNNCLQNQQNYAMWVKI